MSYLTDSPIDATQWLSTMADPTAGALNIFCGIVRNHHEGRAVTSLFYESYRPMAEMQIARTIQSTHNRWNLRDVCVCHRLGRLEPGEIAVVVGVWSDHRAEAFEASRFIIDEIKRTVPIWKHETYADGMSEWVRCFEVVG